jgi:hypothetical protein
MRSSPSLIQTSTEKLKRSQTLDLVPSHEELLEQLRQFLQKHGKLSEKLIKASLDMPSTAVYDVRFGGLAEAYRRIGYHPVRSLSHVERDRARPMANTFLASRQVETN